MNTSPWLARAVLLAQTVLVFIFEKLVLPDLLYMSAYGVPTLGGALGVWIIPALLLLASFLPFRWRPLFYATTPLLLMPQTEQALITIGFSFFIFHVTTLRRHSAILTGTLLAASIAFIFFVNLEYVAMNWFFLLIHVTWGLKQIAWIVSVRVYHHRYSKEEFLDYFFNPVFFFFTNDLNVLTPNRFTVARKGSARAMDSGFDLSSALRLTGFGLLLILAYGSVQKYYFLNLENIGVLGVWWIGGAVSVAVAILFHAANTSLQVSFLRTIGYGLPVDMDRPWLATSPYDYWKRMHFYVREYVLDILIKPVFVFLVRRGFRLRLSQLLSLFGLYFVFTCTQIGYQPYRQPRTLEISALVTLVFILMVGLPELISSKNRERLFQRNPWVGRSITFAILVIGYSLIFYLRRGF